MVKIVKDKTKNLEKLIVERLVSNSDIAVEALASEYNVSNGTIRNKISYLLESNILIGYKARARLGRLGMSEAIVGLDIKPENYVEATNTLKRLGFINELYRASGDHSAIAIIVSSTEEIDDRIKEIMSVRGVRKAYPSFVQETLK